MVENILDDMVYGSSAKQKSKKQKGQYQALAADDESDSEEECDENGDVQICEDCGKVVAASKYERHRNYYCEMRMAECPICNEMYPMIGMEEHMEFCESKDLVTCMICKGKFRKEELKDHAIAHNI